MVLLSVIAVLLFIDLLFFINDKYVVSFFGLIGILAGAWYFIPEVAMFVAEHGWLYLTGTYLGIGLVVGAGKWLIANVSLWIKLRNCRSDFQRDNPPKDEPLYVRQSRFANYWNNKYASNSNSMIPCIVYIKPEAFENNPTKLVDSLALRAKDHVERISFWVLQWPLVIVATALEDLVVNVGKNLARFFDYAFTQFSRRVVASTVKDL